MIDECILHVGMHKTGSSSIQQTFSRLKMKDCLYLDLGLANHSCFIATMTLERPENYHAHRLEGRTTAEVKSLKIKNLDIFRAALKNANKRRVIISAEWLSSGQLSSDQLKILKNELHAYCKKIKVVGYIRPPIGYMESAFQQHLKGGSHINLKKLKIKPNYRIRFEPIDQAFGVDNVELIPFRSKDLYMEDVVFDFAHRLNIDISKEEAIRSNESLSLEASSFLYLHRNFIEKPVGYRNFYRDNNRLVEAVAKLKARKIKFSSKLVSPLINEQRDDIDWISRRLGVSILDEANSSSFVVSSEADIFQVAAEQKMNLWELWYESAKPDANVKGVAALVDMLYHTTAEGSPVLLEAKDSAGVQANQSMIDSLRKLTPILRQSGFTMAHQNIRQLFKIIDDKPDTVSIVSNEGSKP